LIKMNSYDDDSRSANITPDIQQVIRLLQNISTGNDELPSHTGQQVSGRLAIGIPVSSVRHSGFSDDSRPRRREDPNGYVLELTQTTNRRFDRLEKQLDRKQDEIDQLNITIYGLKRQLDEESEKRQKADDENVVLREKVKKFEEHTRKSDVEVARLREEVKQLTELVTQHQQDIATLLKEKEDKVFSS